MLENIVIKSKTVEVEYPYTASGFKVQLAYLTKDEVVSLREQSTKTKITKHSRIPEETFDEELFTKLFVPAIVKNWSGLTYKILSEMLPTDSSKIENKDEEIPYNEDDLLFLMRNSTNFDNWVSEVANDLSVFTKGE